LAEQWIVAPKAVGSSPSSYPMNNFLFFFYNYFIFNFFLLKKTIINDFFHKTYFLKRYFILNDLIWQEGLLIDFLQKKIIDNWVKKFLIYSSYLFNERLVFDKITRFYLDLIIWPMHKLFIFEFNNVSSTLLIIFFFFIFFFFIFSFFYLFHLLF
jgi:hypothetical protein